MAADEALTRSMLLRGGAPFVRFYRWDPPSLSFGFFQPVERLIDPSAAVTAGIGLVRRQSGGKMVFHANEITFAIGMPLTHLRRLAGDSADFLACFQALMRPLVDALASAGVPARFSDENEVERGRSDRIHCYAAAAGHSVYAGGRKLIGAAGIIKGDILTVHGSLPISRSVLPETVFIRPLPPSSLPDISVLNDFITPDVIATLPGCMASTLADRFGLEAVVSGYDDHERREIEILRREKYSRLDWKTITPARWDLLLNP